MTYHKEIVLSNTSIMYIVLECNVIYVQLEATSRVSKESMPEEVSDSLNKPAISSGF
jgi:hypothetical protein